MSQEPLLLVEIIKAWALRAVWDGEAFRSAFWMMSILYRPIRVTRPTGFESRTCGMRTRSSKRF